MRCRKQCWKHSVMRCQGKRSSRERVERAPLGGVSENEVYTYIRIYNTVYDISWELLFHDAISAGICWFTSGFGINFQTNSAGEACFFRKMSFVYSLCITMAPSEPWVKQSIRQRSADFAGYCCYCVHFFFMNMLATIYWLHDYILQRLNIFKQ